MEISVRHKQSCVKSQSDRPTCAAFAATAFHEYCVEVTNGHRPRCELDLSEEFLYYYCKQVDGCEKVAGTTISAASSVLKVQGQCTELLFPYRVGNSLASRPSGEAICDAKTRLYGHLTLLRKNRQVIETSLANGLPLIAVAEWHSNSYLAPMGRIEMPAAAHRHLGRHAILIVGVNDESPQGYLISFKNSWGQKWGDGGFGSFGLEYFNAFCRQLWG
jgi:C1A family cysteine protease